MSDIEEFAVQLDRFHSTLRKGTGGHSLTIYFAAIANQQACLGSPAARQWWSRVSDNLERKEEEV